MKTHVGYVLVFSIALLLFARPGLASSTICGMEMLLPDCQVPSSGAQWAPDSEPTIGLGCTGYPTPRDAAPQVSYFTPMLSGAKLVIEAGGETLTGGTFSDAAITCRKACLLVAGTSSNCPVSAIVRYSGPLIPGKEHKISWTNAGNTSGYVPVVVFTVSTPTSVDAGLATASGTGTTTGAATSAVTNTGTATATMGSSTSAASATDTGTATTTIGSSTSAASATDTGSATATIGSSTSAATATDTDTLTATTGSSTSAATDFNDDAGTAKAKRSSSCSCALGAREHPPLLSLLALAPLGLVGCLPRIASRARTRSRTPHDSSRRAPQGSQRD